MPKRKTPKKPRTKPPNPKAAEKTIPQWKKLEAVVSHLQKAIGRTCHVAEFQHLTHKALGIKRQFDAIILDQLPGCTFTSVVEVQKRSRKVGFPQLEAWIAKANYVNAHRLICVSEKGFTETAIQLAKYEGAKVDLAQILPYDGWPPELPQIEMDVGVPRWVINNPVILLHMKAKPDGTGPKKGAVEHGNIDLAKTQLVLNERLFLQQTVWREMVALYLYHRLPNLMKSGTTVDVVFPVLQDQVLKCLLPPYGLVHVGWFGYRMSVEVARYSAKVASMLQYKNVKTGEAEAFFCTTSASVGDSGLVRVDLAMAPAKNGQVASIVSTAPKGMSPSVGDGFTLVFGLGPFPPLRAEIRVHRGDPPPMDVPDIKSLPKPNDPQFE